MGALASGIAGGVGQGFQGQQQQMAEQDERQRDREQRTLETLLKSPYPDIQTAAVAGLANPVKRSGKGVWTGVPLHNDYIDKITQLMRQAGGPGGAVTPGNPVTPEQRGAPPKPSAGLNIRPGGANEDQYDSIMAQMQESPAAGGVQPVATPTGGAPSAAMPATAVSGQNAPAAEPPAWVPTGLSGNPADAGITSKDTTPPPTPPPQMRGAFRDPVEEAGMTAEAQEGGKIRGAINAARGAGQIDPGTRRTLMEFGITRPTPPPAYGGQVLARDVPLDEQQFLPAGTTPDTLLRRQVNRVTGGTEYVPITPSGMVKPSLRVMQPAGEPAGWYNVYSDGSHRFVGGASDKEQNIPVTHPDGSQEIVRLPAVRTSSAPGTPASTAVAAPSAGATGAPPAPPSRSTPAPGSAPSPVPRPNPQGARGALQTKPATISPQEVSFYADQALLDSKNLTALNGEPLLKAQVLKELATRGVNITNLDQQSRAMAISAKDVVKMMPKFEAEAREMERLGLMGPLGGRWRDLLAGKIGAGELAGGSAENATKIGEFMGDAKLMASALGKAHFGLRGGVSGAQQFENLLGAGWKDAATFKGGLMAAKGWMSTYADRLPSTVPTKSGEPPPSRGGGTVRARDPKGVLHEAPAGTPLPAGWKIEQ